MIDSNFIIKYTNALYSTPPEFAPRYDEFRDMFSSGQIQSKEWLLRELAKFDIEYRDNTFIIVGAWFGTLGVMAKQMFRKANIIMIDIDPRCEKFVHNIIYNAADIKYTTEDMYEHHYTEDIIINTSCEHIVDIRKWINCIPLNRTIVLQSNNYLEGNDHINCVGSEEEFVEQTGLSNIIYSGKLEMPMYTRFMVIGIT